MQMNKINWKYEAQKQAADAGELKMKLAARLEELRTEYAITNQHCLWAESEYDQVVLQWKSEQLQKQIDWLEGILYGHREQNSAADC